MLLLTGCNSIPFINQQSGNASNTQQVDVTQQAKRFEQQGNYLAAAKSYMQLVARSAPPLQQEYHLSAIDMYIKGKMLTEARIELDRLNLAQAQQLMPRHQLILARLEIEEGNPNQALQRLNQINLTGEWQLQQQQTRILALEAQGNLMQALQERVSLDQSLRNNRTALLANHDQIWKLLLQLPNHQLSELSQQNSTNELLGWVKLSLLARNSTASSLPQLLSSWKTYFPAHTANVDIVPMLQQGKQPTLPTTSVQIALLLPLTGQFAPQANAIQQGFSAALYNDPQYNTTTNRNRPKVTFYDTTGKNIQQVYQSALNEGASVVIGPVERDSILQLLAGQTQLPVPTLALNYVQSPTLPKNFYQFGLSPSEEAQDVATKAWGDGYRRAAILVPEGAWGERVAGAFRDTWQQRGGQVVGIQFYSISDNDSSIRSAVKNLVSAPAEVVLLGAYSQQARLIVPFFRYYYTQGNLPIYGTSTVYLDGVTQPNIDNELEGLIFGDMPWILSPTMNALQLQNSLQQPVPDLYSQFKRIFAFGADVYQLIPKFMQPMNYGVLYKGYTGDLVLETNGEIDRELVWAKFVNGTPMLLNPAQPFQQQQFR